MMQVPASALAVAGAGIPACAGIGRRLVFRRFHMRACATDSRSRTWMLARLQIDATSVVRRCEPSAKSHPPGVIDHQIRHCMRAYGLRALLVATDGALAFVGAATHPRTRRTRCG